MQSQTKKERRTRLQLLVASILIVVATTLLIKLVQPIPFRYVAFEEEGQTMIEVSSKTKGSKVLLGTTSHILPLVRVINYLGEPIKRWLIPFDVKVMKEEAIELVGYDDFGNMADWEAFDRLVEVANVRCHLFGRVAMKGLFHKVLATNLEIQQLLKEHPEIQEEVIERPIFMAAFTRTGATFLYQVLADIFEEELTPTYSYELFAGPLELQDSSISSISREKEAELALTTLGTINPPMKLLHEWIAADEPEDEPGWFQYTLMGLVIPFTLPSEWHHAKIYEESSQRLNRQMWETLNKIKQWRAGKKLRFLLKAPEHLFGFPELYESYPDGSFITVSRDEASWYESSLVITHLYQQMFVDARVNDTIAFTDMLNCGQRRSLQIAHNGSYDVLPVQFGSYLFTQTFDVVEKIATYADLPFNQEYKEKARDVISKRLSWKKEKSVYKLDDFGLTRDKIAERLETMCQED